MRIFYSGTKGTYDRKLDISGTNFGPKGVDVFNPSIVFLKAVSRNTDDFNIAFGKVVSAASYFTEFGRANWSEISRMGEKNSLNFEVNYQLKCAGGKQTQELPIHSWNLMRPAVVSASKSGATLPSRRAGIANMRCLQCCNGP